MKHLRIFTILITVVVLNSCSFANYKTFYTTPRSLDFNIGKWLVNYVDTDLSWNNKNEFTENLIEGLKKYGGDSIVYLGDIQLKYITPTSLKHELSKEAAEILNKTTDFEFIVNIKTRILKDDLLFFETEALEDMANKSEIEIAVYHIKSGNLIYNQRTIASISMAKGDKNTFVSTASSLTFKALKKALRNIKKHSQIKKS